MGKCKKINAFRGRRPGSPEGGFYATDELFASTYGPVEKRKVELCNPKKISMGKWRETFGAWDILTHTQKQEMKKNFTKDGHDSVVVEHKTPSGETIKIFWKKNNG